MSKIAPISPRQQAVLDKYDANLRSPVVTTVPAWSAPVNGDAVEIPVGDSLAERERSPPKGNTVIRTLKFGLGMKVDILSDVERNALEKRFYTWIRKTLRFTILMLIVVVSLFGLWWNTYSWKISESVLLPSNTDLKVSLKNCHLELTRFKDDDDRPPSGRVEVYYRFFFRDLFALAAGGSLTWQSGAAASSGWEVTLHNKLGGSEGARCTMFLNLGDAASLQSLNIECIGRCIISTQFPSEEPTAWSPTWNVAGTLSISSRHANAYVKLQDLDVGALHVEVGGDIYLENVKVRGTQTSAVYSTNGDFYAELQNHARIRWTQSTNLFCFAAPLQPYLQNIANCNATPPTSSNSSSQSLQVLSTCSGETRLCPTGDCNPQDTVPLFDLELPLGSFYVTWAGNGSERIHPSAGLGFGQPTKSDNGEWLYPLEVDASSLAELERVKKLLVDGDGSIIYTLESGAHARYLRTRSDHIWAVSRSKAAAQVGPWWLRIVSMGLLIGNVEQLTIRFQAGSCPYRASADPQAVRRLGQKLGDLALEDKNNNVLAHIVPYDAKFDGVSYPHERVQFEWHSVDGAHRTRWFDMGAGQKDELSWKSNTTLTMACVVSVWVSIFVGLATTRAAYVGVSNMVWMFGSASSHFLSYCTEIEKEDDEQAAQQLSGQGTWSASDSIRASQSGRLIAPATIDDEEIKHHKRSPKPPRSCSVRVCKKCYHWMKPLRLLVFGDDGGAGNGEDESNVQDALSRRRYKVAYIWQLPPIFSVTSHLVNLLRNKYTKSLNDFLDLEGVIRSTRELAAAVQLADFKNLYSKYAFLTEKEETQLKTHDSKKIFKKHGLGLRDMLPDEQAVAFMGLTFKSMRTKERKHHTREVPDPGETSLDFFIRVSCEKSPHDSDTVLLNEFKHRYLAFCVEHRLAEPVTVSRALMAEKDINTVRLAATQIVSTDDASDYSGSGSPSPIRVLDLVKAKEHVDNLCNKTAEPKANSIMKRGWWIFDLLAVASHLSLIVLVAFVPELPLCAALAATYSQLSTHEPYFILLDEMGLPSTLWLKLFYDWPELYWSLLIKGCLFVLAGFMELTVFYLKQEFPYDARKLFSEAVDMIKGSREPWEDFGCFRRTLHIFQWIAVFYWIFWAAFFLMLLLVWSILGALINPTKCLAYATAMGTLVAFVTNKYRVLYKLYNMSISEIAAALEKQLKVLASQMVMTMMNEFKDLAPIDAITGKLDGKVGEVLKENVSMVADSKLGKNIVANGLDVSVVVGLATGDTSALAAFAEQSGVPPEIVHMMIGAAASPPDKPAIVKAVGAFMQRFRHLSPLHPELAMAITDLALTPSRPKVEKCIESIFQHVLPLTIKLFSRDKQLDDAAWALLADVLPLLMKGLLGLAASHDYGLFVDSLRKAHHSLQIQRQQVALFFGQDVSKLFEQMGPVFEVIELALGTGNILAGNISEAILKILEQEQILNMDPAVSQFVRLVLVVRPDLVENASLAEFSHDVFTSFSARRKILKAVCKACKLHDDYLVILEMLLSHVIADIDFFASQKKGNGHRLAKFLLRFISDTSGVKLEGNERKVAEKVLGESCGLANALVASSRMANPLDLCATFQERSGLSAVHAKEIAQLVIVSKVSKHLPPPGMMQWNILAAAASRLGLPQKELVGLAHLLMGHASTNEALCFIRAFFHQHGKVPPGLAHLVTAMIDLNLGMSDKAFLNAQVRLRLQKRFLGLLGIGRYPPSFLSETIFSNILGLERVKGQELIVARFDLPFQYEDGRGAWNEWLENLSRAICDQDLLAWKDPVFEIIAAKKERSLVFEGGVVLAAMKMKAAAKGVKGRQALRSKLSTGSGEKDKEVISLKPPPVLPPIPGAEKTNPLNKTKTGTNMKTKKDMDVLQLHLRTQKMTMEGFNGIVENYNAGLKPIKHLYEPKQPFSTGFSEVGMAKKHLQSLQEMESGELHRIDIPENQKPAIALSISMCKMLQSHHLGPKEKDSMLRTQVIQTLAATLNVDFKELQHLFNLVAHDHTKTMLAAIEWYTKHYMNESMAKAAWHFAYSAERCEVPFSEIRSCLWGMAEQFGLPRLVGPALLLPQMSYPPQLRETLSILSYVFAPLLSHGDFNDVLQKTVGDVGALVCHAFNPERAGSLAHIFGIAERKGVSFLPQLLRTMLCSGTKEKLSNVWQCIRDLGVQDLFPELGSRFEDVLPYMMYFAGFPNAQLPILSSDNTRVCLMNSDDTSAAVDIIKAQTNIPQQILMGIEICQMSLSTLSESHHTTLDSTSAIALFVPMFEGVRQTRPELADILPSTEVLKAIISLTFCEIDNLEALADVLGMDTFMMHMLVLLRKVSINVGNMQEIGQILHQIRGSSGISRSMDINLGMNSDKFQALLTATFPHTDDVSMLPHNMERIGFLKIPTDHLQLLYVMASCVLLHLRGVGDEVQHESVTSSLIKVAEPVCETFGYAESIMLVLCSRLVHGDFRVFNSLAIKPTLQLLLPYSLEYQTVAAVCGVLAHEPPSFEYHPVVISGVAVAQHVRPGEFVATVTIDTMLPRVINGKEPIFHFWVLPPDDENFEPSNFTCTADYLTQGGDPPMSGQCFELKVHGPIAFKEAVVVRWQVCPDVDAAELRQMQFTAARKGLLQLEYFSSVSRVNWKGVAKTWKNDLNVHPLFLLLAAGNVNAFRLAADMLGIPEIVIAFLFTMIASLGEENPDVNEGILERRSCLKPLLLADLCVPNVVKGIMRNYPDFLDTGTLLKKTEINDYLGQFHSNDEGLDKPCGACDMSTQKKRHREYFGLGKGCDAGSPSNSSKQGGSTWKVAEASDAGSTLFDALNPLRTIASRKLDLAADNIDPPTNVNDFLEWLENMATEEFPDQLSALLESCLDTDPDNRLATVEANLRGDVLRRRWKCNDRSISSNHFLAAALDALETFGVCTMKGSRPPTRGGASYPGSPKSTKSRRSKLDVASSNPSSPAKRTAGSQESASQAVWATPKAPGQEPVTDKVLERWRKPIPDNLHVLLSTILVQLYSITGQFAPTHLRPGDSAGIVDNDDRLVRGSPTVSLIVCLSQLHQSRLACSAWRSLDDLSALHLLPAMWGLENHFRIVLDAGARRALVTEAVTTGTGSIEGIGKSLTGFRIPFSSFEREPDPEGGSAFWNLNWDDWGWPSQDDEAVHDEFSEISCRIVQVARLALALAKPVHYLHPGDYSSTKAEKSKRRGWWGFTLAPTKKSDDARNAAIRAQQSRRLLLWNDLMNAQAANLCQTVAVCGADWEGHTFALSAISSLPKSAKAIKKSPTLYDAMMGIFATQFDQRVFASDTDVPRKLRGIGQVISYALPQAVHPHGSAGRRINSWVQVISTDLGFDPLLLESLLLIAHGYCDGPSGDLVSPVAFESLARRVRLGEGGAKLICALFNNDFTAKDAARLARHLKLSERIFYGLVSAAKCSVEGWVDIHRYLFRLSDPRSLERTEASRESSFSISLKGAVDQDYDDDEEFEDNLRKFNELDPIRQRTEWLKTAKTHSADKEDAMMFAEVSFFQACISFSHATGRKEDMTFEGDETLDTVEQQASRTSEILQSILPCVLRERKHDDDLVEDIFAMMLHLLSGENHAMVQVLLSNETLCDRLNISEEQARRLEALTFLHGTGARKPSPNMIRAAATAVQEPVLQYLRDESLEKKKKACSVSTKEKQHWKSQADFDGIIGSDQDFESELERMVPIFLALLFGVALEDNESVISGIASTVMRGLRGTSADFIAKARPKSTVVEFGQTIVPGDAVRQLEDESNRIQPAHLQPGISKLSSFSDLTQHMDTERGFTAEDVETLFHRPLCDEMKQLLQTDPNLQAMVFAHSLKMVHDLQLLSKDANLMNIMAGRLLDQKAVDDIMEQPELDETMRAIGSKSLGEVAQDLGNQKNMEGRIKEITQQAAQPRISETFSSGKAREGALPRKHDEAANMLEHLFTALFAIFAKGGFPSEQEVTAFLDKVEDFVPLMAAVALGRMDVLFCKLKVLSQSDGLLSMSPEEQQRIDLIFDLVTLLGLDKEQFLRHNTLNNGKGREFFRRLIDQLLKGVSLDEPLVGTKKYRAIPDESITASSYHEGAPGGSDPKERQMWRIRIDNTSSTWCAAAKDTKPWVEFDFGQNVTVKEIQTKGRPNGRSWTTKYRISFVCEEDWLDHDGVFEANNDANTLSHNKLHALVCRKLRLHLLEWEGAPTLRVEVLGISEENQKRKELVKDAVDLLFGLLLGFLVGAPPDFISGQIHTLTPQLEDYATHLLRYDPTLQNASRQLIYILREIATLKEDAAKKKVNLFEALREGEFKGQVPMNIILDALLDMLLPFLGPDLQQPLAAILRATFELKILAENPSLLDRSAKELVKNVAIALGKPEHSVSGILALSSGDWAAAVDFCRPFCNLDLKVLDQMTKLLPMVKQTVVKADKITAAAVPYTKEETMRLKRIVEDAKKDKSSADSLFDVIDSDKSGCISKEEFRCLLNRLGYNLSEHRLTQIYSKCKSTLNQAERRKDEGLNAEEFKKAVLYVEEMVAYSSLSLMGRSWSSLMLYLLGMTLILIMVFVFLFLGVSAFVTGGVFSSVVNSVMTIVAGLGLNKKKGSFERDDDKEDNEEVPVVLDRVQNLIFNEK